jgi:4-hydroxy-tetrahydrodipicolinate synthase
MTTTTHGNTGTIQGIWLPLITPFLDGALDEASLGRLVRH